MSKVLVFGGTFNPVTNAHIELAKKAKEFINARKVIIVPSGLSFMHSWKQMDQSQTLSNSLRYTLLNQALVNEDDIEVSDIELNGITSKTFDTLAYLQQDYLNDQLVWLCGDDKCDELYRWYKGEELIRNYHFLICSRFSNDPLSRLKNNNHYQGLLDHFTIMRIDSKYVNVSSSQVREAIKNHDFDYVGQVCPSCVKEYFMKQMDYGYLKVASAPINIDLANITTNVYTHLQAIKKAKDDEVSIIGFSELSVCGYTCADLFLKPYLIQQCIDGIETIMNSMEENIIAIVGGPLQLNYRLYNCAFILEKNRCLAIVPKSYIPNYNEFYEARWFDSALDCNVNQVTLFNQYIPFGTDIIVNIGKAKLAVEICEDLWVAQSPSINASLAGANVIFNLSASNETVSKSSYRLDLVKMQSAKCYCGYIYTSSGNGESSTDLVFANTSIIANCGSLLINEDTTGNHYGLIDLDKIEHDRLRFNSQFKHQQLNYRFFDSSIRPSYAHLPTVVDPYPFVLKDESKRYQRAKEIIAIQAKGLATRLRKINCKKTVIGISGGLDSTLALLVILDAYRMLNYDTKDIYCITMPGFGTSKRTKDNSVTLMQLANVSMQEIDIKDACLQHFKDINHDVDQLDVTYENTQARERTQILMDIANKIGGIVVGTGDLSELALGWCTYNGDHMSMYAVNASIPKTLVRYLVSAYGLMHEEFKAVLTDIVDTPISPELLPTKNGEIAQKTEDTIGKYDLQDFFMYHYLRNGYNKSKILALAKIAFSSIDSKVIEDTLEIFYKRFYSQQFKRSCLPDGPKVGSVCISPRGDWRMPSDCSNVLEHQ